MGLQVVNINKIVFDFKNDPAVDRREDIEFRVFLEPDLCISTLIRAN